MDPTPAVCRSGLAMVVSVIGRAFVLDFKCSKRRSEREHGDADPPYSARLEVRRATRSKDRVVMCNYAVVAEAKAIRVQ
jgi:hypothetical protein